MANVRYFRLAAADVPGAVTVTETRHKDECGPGHELSVFWNVAETEALMRVNGANKDWPRGRAWIESCAAANGVYDRDNRSAIFWWFYTPEWQPEKKLQ